MTSDNRSSREIEREIERERAELTDTLDDIQDRFSVEGLARQFTDQFREHGGDIGRSLSESVKRNPMALALTGVGLAWMVFGDRTTARDPYRDPYVDRNRDPYDADRRLAAAERRYAPSSSVDAADHTYRGRNLGAQPGNPARPYYSGRRSMANEPSWARDPDHDDYDDDNGMLDSAKSAASSAGDSVSSAASSAADKARSAGSSAADTARGVGSSAADKARGVGSSVSSGLHSARDRVSGTASSAAEGARNTAHNVSDRVRGTARSASEWAAERRRRLAEGTEHLSEEARNRVIAARERAVEARDQAAVYARRGREQAVDLFEDHPLIAGALAVAVGAALGAALPRSRTEDKYLGEHSDHLFDEAERIYREEREKLGKVAEAATDEAKAIAKEVKDDADEKAPADTAAKAVADKAKKSGQRIANAAQSEAEKQDLGKPKSKS